MPLVRSRGGGGWVVATLYVPAVVLRLGWKMRAVGLRKRVVLSSSSSWGAASRRPHRTSGSAVASPILSTVALAGPEQRLGLSSRSLKCRWAIPFLPLLSAQSRAKGVCVCVSHTEEQQVSNRKRPMTRMQNTYGSDVCMTVREMRCNVLPKKAAI